MSERFSPFVLKALTDVITGGAGQGQDVTEPIGIYRSGPKIEALFLDCGLDMRIGTNSRVPATLQFLRGLADRWDDGDALKRVMLRVSDPREYLSAPEKAAAVREHLNAALEGDGLAIAVVGGRAHLVERTGTGLIVEPFISKVAKLDFDTVQIEIARALPSLNSDPEDAVTAASSLIEAVCRSILIELGLSMPPKRDIDGLLKAVQEPLGLSPGRTDLPTEIEQDIRQVLGGLTSVTKGIGALRTHGGDAHGREKGFRRIDPRIARLALNSASSVALFLIETWESKQRRHLPQHGEGS